MNHSTLTEQEQKWFQELHGKRKNAVSVLKEEGLIKVFVSHIVDTYRESAHFIYELLQNADDVGAKSARFELREDGVLFTHDGNVNFSISNPATERQEGANPGHINSITTFSLSTKKEDIENKIGKFGIGFKSIFQYTDTPHVFNPPYNFRIEEYMIPYQIELESSRFQTNETTVFWLPFNKAEKPALEAFQEIRNKLESFSNPLLFLRNLEKVSIAFDGNNTSFSKSLRRFDDVSLPEIITSEVSLNDDLLIRFDQTVRIADKEGKHHNLPINVAFVLDSSGSVSADEQYKSYFENAWCYFPTYQPTGLNYIVNAPFILTPDRGALKQDRTENDQLFKALGGLLEQSIQGLKQLGKINEAFFTTLSKPDTLPQYFWSLGQKLIDKLKSGEFIPTLEGDHVSVNNAYVCTQESLAHLLSYQDYEPLKRLTKKPNARIVFRNRKLFVSQDLFVFFYKELSAAGAELQATWLGGQFQPSFIEDMPEEFNVLFFKYLSENSSSILAPNQPLWKKQFIPVEQGPENHLLVAPNDTKGQPQVYIGGLKVDGRYRVVDYLTDNDEIKEFLLRTLHSRVPDEFDDFLLSLKKYQTPESVQREVAFQDLERIIEYLEKASQLNKAELIARLRELAFLPTTDNNGVLVLSNPYKSIVYFPSAQLKKYFEKCDESKTWLDTSSLNDELYEERIRLWCNDLKIETRPYYFSDEDILDGLDSFIDDISLSESVYLSHVLIAHQSSIAFRTKLSLLKTEKWLCDSNGVKKVPSEIAIENIHEKYPLTFAGIHEQIGSKVDHQAERYSKLNDAEKKLLEILNPAAEGFSSEELNEFLAEFLSRKKTRADSSSDNANSNSKVEDNSPEGLVESWTEDAISNLRSKMLDETIQNGTIPRLPNSVDFWSDSSEQDGPEFENPGGYAFAPVIGSSYKRDQENKRKAQLEKEIELESKRNQLIELAQQLEPYSFKWFKVLLELEDNFTTEDRVKRNPVRVVFTKADLDEDGLLVLSDTPNIPTNIEDLGEISVQLFSDDEKRTIVGEVISTKKRSLKIKLANPNSLTSVDLSKITRAVVEASSPDFLLERLKVAFSKLPFEDTDLLKKEGVLPAHVKFIFGPPGTGKTTYLSWLIGGKNPKPIQFKDFELSPIMANPNDEKRILVLTPTNKAADVLVERILQNYAKDNDYPEWLIRFGSSNSLEREPVFVGDRRLKPWVKEQCTLVTTIARFPYDKLIIETPNKDDDEWLIKDFPWDYVIFDEASMIHQSAILYALLYTCQMNSSVQFFVGGDPFQIPPITKFEFPYWSHLPEPAVDNDGQPILDNSGIQMSWMQDGGNIYSLLGLMKDDSFINPAPEPVNYPVHSLTTQYRSVSPIGALFSNYRYGGMLKHDRDELGASSSNPGGVRKELEVKNLTLKALNVIRFPVKKHEPVFKARSVNGSPYHLYSALFCVELVKFIRENANTQNGQAYRIGIITPYAIQNTIISRLLEKQSPSELEVITGTVHGFQGDECDMVIVVLNPPRNITRSPRSFLNKKNILNVAISRARDKMILLVPHDSSGEVKVKDLHQINWIEYLAGTLGECKDHIQGYLSEEIESAIWGSPNYIDSNVFATAHQSVNIFTDAAKRYEVRQDDSAIDIQFDSKTSR